MSLPAGFPASWPRPTKDYVCEGTAACGCVVHRLWQAQLDGKGCVLDKYDVEQLSLFMYEHTRYSLADDAYEEGKPAS